MQLPGDTLIPELCAARSASGEITKPIFDRAVEWLDITYGDGVDLFLTTSEATAFDRLLGFAENDPEWMYR